MYDPEAFERATLRSRSYSPSEQQCSDDELSDCKRWSSLTAETATSTVVSDENDEEWEEYDPEAFERASSDFEFQQSQRQLEAENERRCHGGRVTVTGSLPKDFERASFCYSQGLKLLEEADAHVPAEVDQVYSQREHALDEKVMIEIAPGIRARLRGSRESWEAAKSGRITAQNCSCCLELLHCVLDVDYVLCPGCFIVNPVEETASNGRNPSVGLGMIDEELTKWRNQQRLRQKAQQLR